MIISLLVKLLYEDSDIFFLIIKLKKQYLIH